MLPLIFRTNFTEPPNNKGGFSGATNEVPINFKCLVYPPKIAFWICVPLSSAPYINHQGRHLNQMQQKNPLRSCHS